MSSQTLSDQEIKNYVSRHSITNPHAFAEIKEGLSQLSLPGFTQSAQAQSDPLQGKQTPGASFKTYAGEIREKASEAEYSRARLLKNLTLKEEVSSAFEKGAVISSILPKYIKGELPSFNIVGCKIEKPEDFAMLTWSLRSPYMEVLKVAFLNKQEKVVHSSAISVGTVNAAMISIHMILREIPKIAGKTKSNRVILSHNHPSGNPRPSAEDIRATQILEEGLKAAGITLADHIITNGKKYSSWKEGWQISSLDLPSPAWEGVPRSELPIIDEASELEKIVKSLRQADPHHDHVIYGDSKLHLAAIERIPSASSVNDVVGIIARGSGREGAIHVWYESVSRSAEDIVKIRERLKVTEVHLLDASTAACPSLVSEGLMESQAIFGKTAKMKGGSLRL